MTAALLALAAKLPAGLNDQRALEKLKTERFELDVELEHGDRIGALLECADCAYYCAKSLRNHLITKAEANDFMRGVAAVSGFSNVQIEQAAITKYTLRARPGNPKNDVEERMAVAHLV